MDPKSEKSDTEFPPSGKIGRTEKQLSGFTGIACDQDNPLKRLSQTLHKRNVSDSKILAEKTECAVLPDTEDTETVLNKCSRLLFDIAPHAVDKVLLNKCKGSPGYLLDDLHELHRIAFIDIRSFGSVGFDYLNIEEVLSKKDEYMSVEEIIKDLTLSTKILLLFGHRRWYFISRYEKFRILEDSETGVEDDLLKIKYYYSWLLCVNKQNLAKTELCFMWNLITKAVVRIGGSEFKTEIENLASSQTCDPFKIPDKHTEDSQQKRSDEPGPSGSKIKQTSHENIVACKRELHYDLISKLMDIIYVDWNGYDLLLVKLIGHGLTLQEKSISQQTNEKLFEYLEIRGLIGVGNYHILLNVLEGLNEPARRLIQEYKAKIDALSDGKGCLVVSDLQAW